MTTLEFHPDAEGFLAAAADHLAANPTGSTVVASVAARMQRDGTGGVPVDAGFASWWLVVRDEAGQVVGAGMRTAPFEPYPLYLLTMPEDAAAELGRVLADRGEPVGAVNGALPAVEVCAIAYAEAVGGTVRQAEQMRLQEVEELVPARAASGRLRSAGPEDLDLAHRWFDAFGAAAAAQAGRHDPHPPPIESRDSLAKRIAAGEIWFWEDPEGVPVHVTGFNPPSFGVARIGPVYTPDEHRGHGYAAAAVAEVSARLLAGGSRVCLFTDAANATSNGVYERLGYRPVVDMANLLVDLPEG
ncbi:GNAT family N-acetyltransferase [Nocardioides marmoriginsengisoli]|uniref:GNAT family N-acetyltransferase n=1 Tax=Nocardioides marmoriginsengisoli TaxID=661483 RepID=A0A3N0CI98_9ACTN|nr:GNAT family N-acetyltransferase [Nocardioides marmoriginsengisoli]RNL63208.1 GNAT family N-acetyltransferase [Nocardioides marmoriginsengisoli]